MRGIQWGSERLLVSMVSPVCSLSLEHPRWEDGAVRHVEAVPSEGVLVVDLRAHLPSGDVQKKADFKTMLKCASHEYEHSAGGDTTDLKSFVDGLVKEITRVVKAQSPGGKGFETVGFASVVCGYKSILNKCKCDALLFPLPNARTYRTDVLPALFF